VFLVDPADEQFSIGFNILSAHSDLEKNLLASDLVAVFNGFQLMGRSDDSVLQMPFSLSWKVTARDDCRLAPFPHRTGLSQ